MGPAFVETNQTILLIDTTHQSHITPYNRAYRRLALLLHPDKNSHEGAVALLLGGGNLSRMIR